VLGEVQRVAHVPHELIAAVHDERRHPDRRQQVAHVEVVRGHRQRPGGARARGEPLEAGHPFLVGRVVGRARRELRPDIRARGHLAPVLRHLLEARLTLLHRRGPFVSRRARRAGERRIQDERADPPGMVRGERDGRRAGDGVGEHDDLLAADGVEHGERVGDLVVETRRARDVVGQPDAAAVEHDEAGEAREALDEATEPRRFPRVLDLEEPARKHEQVKRALATHLVGDAHLAVVGVSRARWHRPSPRAH